VKGFRVSGHLPATIEKQLKFLEAGKGSNYTTMVWQWQLWLSPRPLRRTDTSREPSILAANDSALFEFKKEDGRWVVIENHCISNPIVRKGLSGPQLYVSLFALVDKKLNPEQTHPFTTD
jgi:hypothetical protein